MANLALRWPKTFTRCEPSTGKPTIRPSTGSTSTCLARHIEPWRCPHIRGFATTPHLGRHRKPKAQNYPSFRNETKDQRLVREHKLFDPFSADDENPLARFATHDRFTKTTTVPVSETSSAVLERELLFRATHNPPGTRLLNLINHLITERREPPNPSHYEALLHANALTERGSAENVRDLLHEMDENNIPVNVNTYTAILRTLVAHPDVDLLDHVIDSCERSWIPLDSEMLHFVCAVYLRADMPELAMEYLNLIEGNAPSIVHSGSVPFTGAADASGKVELWLYVLFLHHLALKNDWDGVLRMCYRLNDDESLGIPLAMRQVDVPYPFWEWLFLRASGSSEASWVMLWIWDLWVRRAWIRPSDQLCMDMLKVSARMGDYQTAESLRSIYYSPRGKNHKWGQATSADGEVAENLEVEQFLNLAYENAGPEVSRMTDREKQKLLPHWSTFNDTIGAEKETGTKMRIDPWAGLPSENDPGTAWPRILQEREANQKGIDMQHEARKAAIESKNPGEVTVAVRSWPGQLQDDLEALASVGLALKGNGNREGEGSTQWVVPFATINSNESDVSIAEEHGSIHYMAPRSEVHAEVGYPVKTHAEPSTESATFSDPRGLSRANASVSEANLESSQTLSSEIDAAFSKAAWEIAFERYKDVPIDPAPPVMETDREDPVQLTAYRAEDTTSHVLRDSTSFPFVECRSKRIGVAETPQRIETMTSKQFFETFADKMSDRKKE